MKISYPLLRIDALGAFTAVALTLGAAALAIGPHVLARGPSAADQQADLDARRHDAIALDRQAETIRLGLEELNKRNETAVHLQPANHVNERLVEITNLAAGGHISIVQMTPGAPGSSASADKSASPSPLDGKAVAVPIKLSGTGSYPDLSRFIHTLRERFRDTAVTAIKLTAQAVSPDSAKSSENVPAAFNIDLAWYAAPAGSADASAKP